MIAPARAGRFLGRILAAVLVALVVVVGSGAAAAAEEPDVPSSSDTAEDNYGKSDAVVDGGLCALGPLGAAASQVLGMDFPCFSLAEGAVGAIGGKLEEYTSSAVEALAMSFGSAAAEILTYALGWWMKVPALDPQVYQETTAAIQDYTYYIQIAFFALTMMLLGARLAMARSGMIREVSEEGLRQMARATVVAGALTGLIVIATRVSDAVSWWFIDGTVGSDPKRLVGSMVTITRYTGTAGIALLFIVGIIGILGGLAMVLLMLLRTGVLVMMSAALPIAASAGGTKVGSQAYEKMLAWTIAFLLVKPVGAFVIGCSAMLFIKATPQPTDMDSGDGLMALSGVILLCAAAAVLPALMRMIVPAIGAVGGGGSGLGAAMAVAGLGAKAASVAGDVAGAVATGGASAAAQGGSSSNGGGPPPPSGAHPGFGNRDADRDSGGQQPQGSNPTISATDQNPNGGANSRPDDMGPPPSDTRPSGSDPQYQFHGGGFDR